MGGKSSGGDQQVTNEIIPPAFIRGNLKRAAAQSSGDLTRQQSQGFFPDPLVAQFNPTQQAALDQLAAFGGGDPNQQLLSSQLSGIQGLQDPANNPNLATGIATQPGAVDLINQLQQGAGAGVDINPTVQSFIDQLGGNFTQPLGSESFSSQLDPSSTLNRLQQQTTGVNVAGTAPTAAEGLGGFDISGALNANLSDQQNPFIDQVVRRALELNTRNFTEQALPSIQSGSSLSGGFGGSRQGVAEGIGLGRLAEANAGTAGSLLSQEFNQGLARRLNAAQLGGTLAGQAGAQQLARQGQENQFGLDTARIGQQDAVTQLGAAGQAGTFGLSGDQLALQRESAGAQAGQGAAAIGANVGGVNEQLSQALQALGLDASALGIGAGEAGTGDLIQALTSSGFLAPQAQASQLLGPQTAFEAGTDQQALEQANIQEAFERFNFDNENDKQAVQNFINQTSQLAGFGGTSVQTGPGLEGPGALAGAVGGAAASAGILGGLSSAGLTVSGPWGWAIMALGALAGAASS